MKTITLFKAILCSLLVFALAYGQRMDRPNNARPNGRILEKLKLSDSQKKDFEKLQTEFAKQRVEQQAKIKVAAIELRSLMKAETPDRAAIEKKINEIGELQSQNRMSRVDHWFAVNKMLNPDQQKVWKELLDRPFGARCGGNFGARFGSRMGQMHNRTMMQPGQRPMMQSNPNQ